ncbi:O-antigen polymerase [Arcicella rigui]|uniref:O-antigen polymerase n=1 Tax=Arcicella rigui TaxID=797020 RepID=A0ABU5Q8V8_9BACT|nr:O-antigen polymerase [Arcicella rigui]MEA5139285.1 O-antigen polymerase [Arcicella rigui]
MIFERNFILNMWLIVLCIVGLASFLYKIEISFWSSCYFITAMMMVYKFLTTKLKFKLDVLNHPHKAKYNLIIFLYFLGAVTCIPLLLENQSNLGKDWSEIREYHLENRSGGGGLYTINFLASPLIFVPYIILSFSKVRAHRVIANTVAAFISFSFIFITGGRVHFIVFGLFFLAIYLLNNRVVIFKRMVSFLIKFILFFILIVILGSLLTLARNTADTSRLMEVYLSLNNVKVDVATTLLQYEWGAIVFVMLTQAFEYVGQCLIFFSMYFDNYEMVPMSYGFYEFNFLDRFGIINWLDVHDKIDYIYSAKFGIFHNVWGTIFRDMIVDFGIFGSLIFLFLLLYLFRLSLKYMNTFLSAQVLYIFLFSLFLFSPFYSLMAIRNFSLSFFCVFVWFLYNLIIYRKR